MTVEDSLELLAKHFRIDDVMACSFSVNADDWDVRFVTNVSQYVRSEKPLSTEQARIVLKLLRRLQSTLVDQGLASAHEIERLIESPTYRQTPYTSANVPREVRYLGDNSLGFRFKMNDVIVADLKKLSPQYTTYFSNDRHWFHRDHRLWVIPVTRDTLQPIQNLIARHRFGFDDAVAEYLTRAVNSLGEAPAFVLDNDLNQIAVSVPDNEIVGWWVRSVLRGERV